jgi:putative restriction endonuclease
VQGKSYDVAQGTGAALWGQVVQRLQQQQVISLEPTLPAVPVPVDAVRYGEYVTRVCLGQGAFRALVTEAYQHRCTITGERTLPVLQAAHIKPSALSGPNATSNGLLLRADLHILFDQGFLTVTPDLQVEVSGRIKEEYENGRDYYALRGRRLLVLPSRPADQPSREFIAWHNEHVFAA